MLIVAFFVLFYKAKLNLSFKNFYSSLSRKDIFATSMNVGLAIVLKRVFVLSYKITSTLFFV